MKWRWLHSPCMTKAVRILKDLHVVSVFNTFTTSAECTNRLMGQQWKLDHLQVLLLLGIYSVHVLLPSHSKKKKKKKTSGVNHKGFQGCWKTVQVLKLQEASKRPFEVCGGSLQNLHSSASESTPEDRERDHSGGKNTQGTGQKVG